MAALWEMNERELGWLAGFCASGEPIEVYRIYDQASWSLSRSKHSAYVVKQVKSHDIAAVDLSRGTVQLASDVVSPAPLLEEVKWSLPTVKVFLHPNLSVAHQETITAQLRAYALMLVSFALEIQSLEAHIVPKTAVAA